MTETYTPEDLDDEKARKDHARRSKYWNAEIHAAEKAQRKFVKRGEKIEKIYNDQRDPREDRKSKFNILWSNVETLRPAVYLRTPKAEVSRRYRQRDPVARFASELLQRCIQTSCEQRGTRNFDKAMKQAVRDRLLPGRGQVWTFYEPEFGPVLDREGNPALDEETGEPMEQKVGERVWCGYVPWKDFLHSVCRTWEENRWSARAFYKTKPEMKDWLKQRRKPIRIAEKLEYNHDPDSSNTDEGLKDERKRAKVFEIWDRTGGKVCFVAPDANENSYLFSEPAPVRYEDFFPCPDPMLGTVSSDSYIPTPDYVQYQDQATELNELTARISVLQRALKVAGIYDASWEALRDLLTAGDNKMIAVEDWAMRKESGGASNAVEWFPIEVVAQTLQQLYLARDIAKQTLYEVSGISDIQRGATDPEETLGAQRIKAQWGTLRTRETQKDVQRFASDAMNLIGEVIAEVFDFDTILEMAGYDRDMLAKYMPPPEPEQAGAPINILKAEGEFLAKAEQMLRNERRWFVIQVETDSTIEPDESEERKARIEIIGALSQFIQQAAILVQQGPEGAKLAGDLILFAMRGFSKAAEIEQTVENAAEAAARKAAQPQPNPEAEKLELEKRKQEHAEKKDQADFILDRDKLRLDKAKTGADVALEAGKLEADLQGRESSDRHADADRDERREQAAQRQSGGGGAA